MIIENEVIKAISSGIPLDTCTPFSQMAMQLGIEESALLASINKLISEKKIKRFGPVIFNRRIGFIHNAMVTIKAPQDKIDQWGEGISKFDFVTLCYQRAPIENIWDYNLYFMIHGKDRNIVLNQINQIKNTLDIQDSEINVLFGQKCFKQKGASY